MVKTILIMATRYEAGPVISHFKLKKVMDEKCFSVFKNDSMVLVICSPGKVNAAMAVAMASCKFGLENRIFFCNIGIAGALNGHNDLSEILYRKGDFLLVNKILDIASNKEFFPDMLVKTGLSETCLFTSDIVVKKNNCTALPGLYDMEASGFFQAALKFAEPHKIAVAKIVSDFLEPYNLSKEKIDKLILKNILKIEKLIISYENFLDKFALNSKDKAFALAGPLITNLRLTSSQTKILTDKILAFKYAGNDSWPDLSLFETQTVEGKSQRNKLFEKINRFLCID